MLLRPRSFIIPPSLPPPPPHYLKLGKARDKRGIIRSNLIRLRCNDTPDPHPVLQQEEAKKKYSTEYSEHEEEDDDDDDNDDDEMKKRVEKVKEMLGPMNGGEITVSPYDTAWVGLVEAIDGSGKPQFPESLEWISENQLEDGSWGDPCFFQAHDRLLNTLACVTALTCWNLYPHKCSKGMEFIRENLMKVGEEEEEHMPIGFEVVFPSLIETAKKFGIHLPASDDSAQLLLQDIYAKRRIKLSRIPKEIMHRKSTTLLHSLEGMDLEGLDWKQLLKLQSKNGSFLFSPSSTAFAFIHTRDLHCFTYLHSLVRQFHGGVPNVYPVDLFEHIWVVDRLQRLGISRFFETESNAMMDYVYRYWTEFGICWARESEVQDIDDTSMGFRLLRLHGYPVSPDVLQHFKKDGKFFCFVGQSTEAVSGMFNLYRASQVQFPGETILEEAAEFSSRFLQNKRASNQLLDKWVIPKDLPSEVAYAIDMPWYANLPRIESRFYIEQYGGEDDVWIGKTLYRMPNVSNNIYLELAKLDFNACQSIHLLDWQNVKRWYIDYNVGEFGLRRSQLLQIYFVAAASIFEPERSNERLAWAKTWAMTTAIATYFRRHMILDSYEQRRVFVDQFLDSNNRLDFFNIKWRGQGLVDLLRCTLNQLSLDTLEAHGVDISDHLHQAWEKWMVKWAEEGDEYRGVAELVARTIHACSSKNYRVHLESADEEEEWIGDYNLLLEIGNNICHQLGPLILKNKPEADAQSKGSSTGGGKSKSIPSEVNSNMQRLVELVLNSNDHNCSRTANIEPRGMKCSVLAVARGYYYSAYCSLETINSHLSKVLFQTLE